MNAAGLEKKVEAILALHRPELEQLVDQALDQELDRLVAERLEARNGAVHKPAQASRALSEPLSSRESATRTCNGPCGRTLPVSAFEKGRAKCRECRRAENRDRQQRRAAEPAPGEPDRPAITAVELAERADRYYQPVGADELELWLLNGGLAERTPAGGPAPTALALGASIN